MLEILDQASPAGKGELGGPRPTSKSLHITSRPTSLCGLGQTAPNPVLSTLRYFRDEYVAHVVDKKCPAGVCKHLLTYTIDPAKCKGCTAMCTRMSRQAQSAVPSRHPHVIDAEKCLKCGACMAKCKFGAIAEKVKGVRRNGNG